MTTEIVRHVDIEAFASEAEPFLERLEAENNLPLGIIGFQRGGERSGPDSAFFGIGHRGGSPVGAVIWTTGWRAVLSWPDDPDFGHAAGTAVRASGLPQQGVLGPPRAAHAFAVPWREAGVSVREAEREPIYRLSQLIDVPPIPGRLRAAVVEDLALLTTWWQGFVREALHREVSLDDARTLARDRIDSPGRTTFLWETDRPVSVAIATGPTRHGIRIGGVYTPPELRGRGYATACVAAVSRLQLEQGRQFCFLFTDATNPTSNAIYRRIGYEQVAEMVALDFEA